MKNRAPRCRHGFYRPLCIAPGCTHCERPVSPDEVSAAQQPRRKRLPSRKPTHRGATVAVREALQREPDAPAAEVAALCRCSVSLVFKVRAELGKASEDCDDDH